MILKSFLSVIKLHGGFEHHIVSDEVVPSEILKLWRERGFMPVPIGIAHVKFNSGNGKDYIYPAHFWVDEEEV